MRCAEVDCGTDVQRATFQTCRTTQYYLFDVTSGYGILRSLDIGRLDLFYSMVLHATPSVGCLGVATDLVLTNLIYDRVLRKDTANGGDDPGGHVTTARTSQTCLRECYMTFDLAWVQLSVRCRQVR